MAIPISGLPQVVTAIGGLGTAAFGLVDATKSLWGGVNHIGFSLIRNAVTPLTPAGTTPENALSAAKILETLKANWFNGTDLASQKAIAKSLIKLNLNPGNSDKLAAVAGVNVVVFKSAVTDMASGTTLTPQESDVMARFDLIITALLDDAYQQADQAYKNGTRLWALFFSILLALSGGDVVGLHWWESLLVGLLAMPLAPVAKDLSTALATAVNTMQLIKKPQ